MEFPQKQMESLHETRREADFLGRDHRRHRQGAEQKEKENNACGEEHAGGILLAGIFHLIGVHRLNLYPREEQNDPRKKGHASQAGDVGEEPGMNVGLGYPRNFEKLKGISLDHPEGTESDNQEPRQHRAQKNAVLRHRSGQVCPRQGDEGGSPIACQNDGARIDSVIRKIRFHEEIGQSAGGEGQYGGIPHHVLDPLKPDGGKSPAGAEGLLYPGVDPTPLTAEGSSQFCRHKRGGDQEHDGGEENVENHGETFLGHHGKTTKAYHCRHSHHTDGEHGHSFARLHEFISFCVVCLATVSPWNTPGAQIES